MALPLLVIEASRFVQQDFERTLKHVERHERIDDISGTALVLHSHEPHGRVVKVNGAIRHREYQQDPCVYRQQVECRLTMNLDGMGGSGSNAKCPRSVIHDNVLDIRADPDLENLRNLMGDEL